MKKERINTEDLLRSTDIVQVVGKYVQLKKNGRTYKGLCPFHDEKSPSFDVDPSKGIYKCFGCGASGDAIAFLMESQGMTFHNACREIGWNDTSTDIWLDAMPPGPPQGVRHPEFGEPLEWYPYTDGENLRGYTIRFLKPDGKKVVLPYTYKFNGERHAWVFQSFEKPRPMYGLERIHGAHTIVFFEGEKTADHGHRLLAQHGYACVSWIGGTSGVRYIDFSPVGGFPVIICPDNDDPGQKAAHYIADTIRPNVASVVITRPIEGKKGADLADTNWTAEQVIQYLNASAPAVNLTPDYSELMQSKNDGKSASNMHFRILGFQNADNSMLLYFFSNMTRCVFAYSSTQLSTTNLMSLAPLKFWEIEFPGGKTEFNLKGAQDWLITTAAEVGMFDPTMVRGRGAWIDNNQVVLHSGSYLIVDGEMRQLGGIRSKFVYDRGNNLNFPTCQPATNRESSRFLELVKNLDWERPVDPYLLAGWCVIAPICGALKWRPHIWLTGPKGSGKSWMFSEVVCRMLGESVLNIEGNTSEAGIRQALQHDAIPVVFDEAEGETKQAHDRIQTVLQLARSASSETGAVMIKGSATGAEKSYKIRSCFAFASISVQTKQQSDRSRVSVLSLRKPDPRQAGEERKAKWEAFQREHNDIITDEFVKALQSRTIGMIPTILANIKAFTAAAAVELGEQRSGDQVGALLAGAFSLVSDHELTFDQALEWIRKQDWSEEKNLNSTEDEKALLAFILEESIQAENGGGGRYTRRLGELVSIASLRVIDDMFTSESANHNLMRYGLKVDRMEQLLYVSNSDKALVKMLATTQWANNHNKILMRLDGSMAPEKSIRFAGNVSRCVAIPLSQVPFGDDSSVPAATYGNPAPF